MAIGCESIQVVGIANLTEGIQPYKITCFLSYVFHVQTEIRCIYYDKHRRTIRNLCTLPFSIL